MNRRDFLKGIVAVTAGGMAMLKLPGEKHTYQAKFYEDGYPGLSDIVLENTEIVAAEQPQFFGCYHYRGMAYTRG